MEFIFAGLLLLSFSVCGLAIGIERGLQAIALVLQERKESQWNPADIENWPKKRECDCDKYGPCECGYAEFNKAIDACASALKNVKVREELDKEVVAEFLKPYVITTNALAKALVARFGTPPIPSPETIRSWMPENTLNGQEIARNIHEKLKEQK